MQYEEKTVKSENIYQGKILSLKVDTIELPDMKYSKREIVEHSGGVGVIAITDEKKIVLVRQYRKAVENFTWEIPAGKLEPNEIPRETGMRELAEETGYRTSNIKYLAEFYPTPGYCSEKIYIFLANKLSPGSTNFDSTENLITKEFTLNELTEMIDNSEIQDAKTIIAILLIKEKLLNDEQLG